MTQAPAHQVDQQPIQAPISTVTPTVDSRLEQLLASYDEAKSAFEGARERFDGIKDGIKSELATAAPNSEKVEVASQYLDRPLRMSYRLEWRVDTRRLKDEQPATYVEYARQIGSWRLEAKR